METDLLLRGSLALALGIIIGFQREQKLGTMAGIRTFPILSLIGFFSALLHLYDITWIIPGALIAVTVIVARGMGTHEEIKASGITTEVTALFVVLMGASFALVKQLELIVVAGGLCAILLHMKSSMHGWVRHMNSKQIQAIMQFILIAFVILPILPDKTYDEFGVLNPRKIWLMVVLINGISLVSFSVQKIAGEARGTVFTGILGGFISSTATTVTLSRRAARNPKLLFVIPALVIASTTALIRVFAEIFVVAPVTFKVVSLPLSLLFVTMIALSIYSYIGVKDENINSEDAQENPSQIKAALVFGFLFAVILYLSAWTRNRYGEQGLYIVSFFSGLIDVDAITLSTAQLVEQGVVKSETGWQLIMTAFLSNLFFKAMIVFSMAKGKARTHVVSYFVASIIAGLIIITLM